MDATKMMLILLARAVVRGLLAADPSYADRRILCIKAVRFALHDAGIECDLKTAKDLVLAEVAEWQQEQADAVQAVHQYVG